MSISFTCEKCGKKIKAPDDTGGQHGSCPACGFKCYIPLPLKEGEEELTLAPLDEESEVTHDEMMKQTYSLTENILHETALPDDAMDGDHDGRISERELLKYIIIWVRQMVAGQLSPAEATANKLKKHSVAVKDITVRMRRAQKPEPDLADIPQNLVAGMLKQLYSQL